MLHLSKCRNHLGVLSALRLSSTRSNHALDVGTLYFRRLPVFKYDFGLRGFYLRKLDCLHTGSAVQVWL